MIQDLIVNSRRMASLYRFRYVEPAHLLHAISANETGRGLISAAGIDVITLRAAIIREFKAHAAEVRDVAGGVEASQVFDACCQRGVPEDLDTALLWSYATCLEEVILAIIDNREHDRIVDVCLSEAGMGVPKVDLCDELEPLPENVSNDLDRLLDEVNADESMAEECLKAPDAGGDHADDRHAFFDAHYPRPPHNPQKKAEPEAQKAVKPTKEAEEAHAAVRAALRDLSSLAIAGSLDLVIGRDKEMDRMVEILLRRRKPNIILVAEPGVGKTALVEGLATRLAMGDCPDRKLSQRPVLEVSLPVMVAGSRFRGDFESRMSILIAEAEKNRSILFIDEIHMLMGSGSASARGGMDGANILKPALARDGMSVIGATTPDEAAILKEDAALMRRFEMIYINEPGRDQMEEILRLSAPNFLSTDDVKISAAMQRTLLDFGERYLNERRNPDRTFDILDYAAVGARLSADESITIDHIRHAVRRLGGDLPEAGAGSTSGFEDALSARLHKRVAGHREAMDDLTMSVVARRSLGIADGLILLAGPAKLGKTHAASVVAEHFGRRLIQIRFDLHAVNALDSISRRIADVIKADPYCVIALKDVDRRIMGDIDMRFKLSAKGALVFGILHEDDGQTPFGFAQAARNVKKDDVVQFKKFQGHELEDLKDKISSDVLQFLSDSGQRKPTKVVLKKLLERVVSEGVAGYSEIKAGVLAIV